MIPKKIFNSLTSNIKFLLLIYLSVQIAYLIFYPVNYSSDSLFYYQLAQGCLANNSFYPASQNLYNDYLVAPLYINILIVLLSIINSKIVIGLLNVTLNFVQLYLVYKISQKLFGKDTAKTSIVIYVFYLSTLGMILLNYTELLFMTLILGSIYFYYGKSGLRFFISGILAAAAIGVRPLAWALVAAYILNLLVDYKNLRVKLPGLGFLVSGVAVFILCFGLFTYSFSGRFIFTSTNGPINILIGANDDATGAYNDKVFEKGSVGYIENPERFTYDQKQNLWMNEAENWITAHPIKWFSLFPMKLVHMFVWDDFSVSPLLNIQNWNLYRVARNILSNDKSELLGDLPLYLKILYIILLIVHHLYYFSIVFLFLLVIFKFYKEIIRDEMLRLLILFCVLGISIHLLTFGDARYKYPYIIIAMIFISPAVKQLLNKGKLFNLKGEYGKNYV